MNNTIESLARFATWYLKKASDGSTCSNCKSSFPDAIMELLNSYPSSNKPKTLTKKRNSTLSELSSRNFYNLAVQFLKSYQSNLDLSSTVFLVTDYTKNTSLSVDEEAASLKKVYKDSILKIECNGENATFVKSLQEGDCIFVKNLLIKGLNDHIFGSMHHETRLRIEKLDECNELARHLLQEKRRFKIDETNAFEEHANIAATCN